MLLIAIVVTAWCPWFEPVQAKQLIYNKVRESQSTLKNGCVLTIDQNSLEKMPFGYKQTVAYSCTFNTDLLSEGKNIVFVTFFNTVLNVPHPLIRTKIDK